MKKQLLTFLALFSFLCFSQAQEKNYMLGLSHSYEMYEFRSSYWVEYEPKTGSTLGLEYSETKGFFGYRAGIFYSKLKNQTVHDYFGYFGSNGLPIPDIYRAQPNGTISIIDFPISGQIYIPLGSPKIKIYCSVGLITSLSNFHPKEDGYGLYDASPTGNSVSIRNICGIGFAYQFMEHFGLDLGINRKQTLHSFDNNPVKPHDSWSISTTLNYIF